MPTNPSDLRYRPCAGMMVINEAGLVFVAQRLDTKNAWQMPQGGINKNEPPLRGAWRELEEETSITPAMTKLLGESQKWLSYDLPAPLQKRLWNGRFEGQRQKWFAFLFIGSDDDINLATATPEFVTWKWAHPDELVALAIPFKRDIYRSILTEFKEKGFLG